MTNYWIGDTAGRVLGPLTLQALRDLVGSGRLKAVNRASRDGTNWIPIQDFEEVKDLLAKAKPSPAADQQNAERIRTQMRMLQAKTAPHEVFGVLSTANLDELRLAFFRMAKRFSPDHLAPDTHPDLRKASHEMFDFLSAKMREAEARPPQGTPARGVAPLGAAGARAVPPGSTAPFPPASPMATQVRKQVAAPTYSSDEFVGLTLRHHNDQVHADIHVTPHNVGMFVDHRLINLSSGGLFINTRRPLKLGTKVILKLNFDQPQRSIELRSAVIWEHAMDDGRQPQGYGLGLASLRPEEKTFLQEFVRSHRKE
ncbi:TIGR02266 family protein [Hyalangium rubrum]|uniref:TIGR02266 family protein n=1 Tax=Hyalangium rubrum TaxID=3103134 RepID=A0ABU5HFL6_9BACT|nr:TIGR02266 family protein [Hyalangium sp. s54d21]MDY7232036.1 TIGR02266 family protein [Hyalangium sp. s54d21]